MSKIQLDKSKPYGHIVGDTEGRVFEQGAHFFNGDGKLWVDPDHKETAAEKKAREADEAAEAKRIADEQVATEKAAKDAENQSQLAAQLGAPDAGKPAKGDVKVGK
jgi:hypothetical protein